MRGLRLRLFHLVALGSFACAGSTKADVPPKATPAATPTVTAASADTTLTCEEGYVGRKFVVDTSARGKYVQTTEVELKESTDEFMRPFQEPGEERLSVRNAALVLQMNPKTCTISRADRAHFLECPNMTDGAVSPKSSAMSFTYDGTSALGARQSVSVVRGLQIASASLHAEIQQKKGALGMEDRVVATITLNALVGGKPRALRVTKDLGEWTARTDRSANDRCFVTAQ